MSKYVASESKGGHETPKANRKRGGDDEEEGFGKGNFEGTAAEIMMIATTVSTAPATTGQFMHTPEFRGHFVDFIPGDTLMRLRLAMKAWKAAADALIDEGVESGTTMVHDGNDITWRRNDPRAERRKLVTRLIFLLNITKVGHCACKFAINLVVVEIPMGVEIIGESAFNCCRNLTTVSFPTTLTSIGYAAFGGCTRLENVDFLHTNLQELCFIAFAGCSDLKSMTIPDSLQTLGLNVFLHCSKPVPSSIDVSNAMKSTTSEVVAHLRSQQLLSATPPPAPPPDEFILTNDFRRLLVQFVPTNTLMALRSASKAWKAVVEVVIDDGVASGAMLVHGGNDSPQNKADARNERRKLVTRVIFLLNITKAGRDACWYAKNLVVVDIPEGVESIGQAGLQLLP